MCEDLLPYEKDDLFCAYSFASCDIHTISSGKRPIWGNSWWITCWLLPFVLNSCRLLGESAQKTNLRASSSHSMKLLLLDHMHAFTQEIYIYWAPTTWMKGYTLHASSSLSSKGDGWRRIGLFLIRSGFKIPNPGQIGHKWRSNGWNARATNPETIIVFGGALRWRPCKF